MSPVALDNVLTTPHKRYKKRAQPTYVLLLLAVVSVHHVGTLVGERHGGDGSEGDTLVGRAEENVKGRDTRLEGTGKGVGGGREKLAVVKEAGVEEVGRLAAVRV